MVGFHDDNVSGAIPPGIETSSASLKTLAFTERHDLMSPPEAKAIPSQIRANVNMIASERTRGDFLVKNICFSFLVEFYTLKKNVLI